MSQIPPYLYIAFIRSPELGTREYSVVSLTPNQDPEITLRGLATYLTPLRLIIFYKESSIISRTSKAYIPTIPRFPTWHQHP
jgi:hypothetical protein